MEKVLVKKPDGTEDIYLPLDRDDAAVFKISKRGCLFVFSQPDLGLDDKECLIPLAAYSKGSWLSVTTVFLTLTKQGYLPANVKRE